MGKVCLIVLNRPKKYNAFNDQMYSEVSSALKSADANAAVSVIVLTGNGAYYSSGNDLKEFAQKIQSSGSDKRSRALDNRSTLYSFIKSIMDVKKPLIAGVNGPAVGIAVTTLGLFDFVFCASSATFHTPFSALGQSPEGLSSYLFPRMMGTVKANALLMLGQKWTADQALHCNLVNEVWDCTGENYSLFFREKLLAVANKLASFPNQGLIEVKRLMKMPDKEILEKVLNDECDLLVERWQSKECQTAIMQFFMRKAMQKQKKKKKKKMKNKQKSKSSKL